MAKKYLNNPSSKTTKEIKENESMVTASRGKRDSGKKDDTKEPNLYKGILILKNFSKNKTELDNLIKNQDEKKDLMNVEKKENELIYYFSDNKVAMSIGKKINNAYKESELDIKFSKYEDTARIYLDFSDK
ncbi:MAG: hypothetical protein ABID45_03485 [Patescibacteria group bacterium]